MTFDPVSQDPPIFDAQFPPKSDGISFTSQGAVISGLMMSAQGPGPHPTIILLHGFPGNERNLDLGQILRRAGWNVLFFSYRGAWGSGGSFTFAGALDDVDAAIAWVRGPGGAAYACDPSRIVLLGQSMGGWAALMTVAHRDDLLGTVATAPWNIGVFARVVGRSEDNRRMALGWFQESTLVVAGTTAEKLLDEVFQMAETGDLAGHSTALASRRALIVAAAEDEAVPNAEYHVPLMQALHAAGESHVTDHVLPHADHAFSGARIALARVILRWLDSLLAG